MSERSLPASPRRLALARAAGWVAHAPSLTTAAAWAGALAALASTAPALGAAWRALWRQSAVELVAGEPAAGALALRAAGAIAAAALPVVGAAAVAAWAVHLLQVRAFFLPRRRVPGAPLPPRSARVRLGAAAWALARAAALTAVGVGALWANTAELAAWWQGQGPSGAAAAARIALALAVAWAALGALELLAAVLLRQVALRMTASEQRQEVREQAGARAFWRRRPPSTTAAVGATRRHLADATVLVLGEAVAVAVRWQPTHHPEPEVILLRRGPAVTYALALARRAQVPVVQAPRLAAQLAAAARDDGERAEVPAPARAALAEVVVAVRRDVAPR